MFQILLSGYTIVQLCLFFLPATAVIPLHNHPEMTVFSKLLLGTMHIKSYDLVDPVPSHDSMQHSQREYPYWESVHTHLLHIYTNLNVAEGVGSVTYQCYYDFAGRLARLVADKDFTSPCDTSVLYPTTGGNIHEFTAITTCAVLDVLGPPYSKEDGRDGSHYKEVPFCAVSSEWN